MEILEYGGYRLTDSGGMCDLVPFIHSNKETKIQEELLESLCHIFDDTTRLGEAFAVVLRFVSEEKMCSGW